MGLRLDDLGTPRLTWVDLRDVVANLPVTSALSRAMNPDSALTVDHYLLRLIEFRLHVLGWMQTKDAQSAHPQHRPDRLVPLTTAELAEFAEEEAKRQPDMPDAMDLGKLRELLPMS